METMSPTDSKRDPPRVLAGAFLRRKKTGVEKQTLLPDDSVDGGRGEQSTFLQESHRNETSHRGLLPPIEIVKHQTQRVQE